MTGRRLGRLPAAARWCALVAFLNALVWGFVTPPFHVPDENAHIAYVQYLAETGKVPNSPHARPYASDESVVLDALLFNSVVGRPGELAPFSETFDEGIERAQNKGESRDDGGGIIESSGQPPLYYALSAVAYRASPWSGLVDRLMLIRVLSALIGGVAVAFVFLFLREVLSEPWTWTVGALAVAVQPLFGFMSGGVNPDVLLAAASAGLFYLLARGFRQGLTLRLGLAIGAALAVGLLTKMTFLALVPGALLGLAVLVWRARADRRQAMAGAAVAVGVLAGAALLYVALNVLVWDRAALGGVEDAVTGASGSAGIQAPLNLAERLVYTWQLYLPRLPFMHDEFNYFPLYDTWFRGFVGRFGWLEIEFPLWTYRLALGIFAAILGLFAAALWRRRSGLRLHLSELATYAVMVAGLLGAIAFSGVQFRHDRGFAFEQARYLLPLLPLYGAFIALAATGAGSRLARPIGALMVIVALGHGLLAQLLVIARFYG